MREFPIPTTVEKMIFLKSYNGFHNGIFKDFTSSSIKAGSSSLIATITRFQPRSAVPSNLAPLCCGKTTVTNNCLSSLILSSPSQSLSRTAVLARNQFGQNLQQLCCGKATLTNNCISSLMLSSTSQTIVYWLDFAKKKLESGIDLI